MSELSRLELYRATWISDYLGEPSMSRTLRQRALSLKSPHARLDLARRGLFTLAASGEVKPEALRALISNQLRRDVSPEPEFTQLLITLDALSCLTENERLDLHHWHPGYFGAAQRFNTKIALSSQVPPRECRQVITNSLSNLEDTTRRHLPIVMIAQAQLLISLGQGERAERLLKLLIEREPTMIEARLSYALLLLRSGRNNVSREVKWAIEPLIGMTRDRPADPLMRVLLKSVE